MSNIAAVWRSDLAAAMVVCWLSSGGVGDLRRSRYFADRISYNSSRQPCCTSLIYIEMDQLTISGLCTFKFQVKSSNFLELWFTACSLWTALEMFFWKNIGNLLYLDPLSTTSSTLRYLIFPPKRSSEDDFCVFAEQGDQPNWHPPGYCNTPSLSHLNIQVDRASWKHSGTCKACRFMGWNKILEAWYKLQFPVLQVQHLLCGGVYDRSSSTLRHRVPPPCCWHDGGLLLRVLRDDHQGQLCCCIRGCPERFFPQSILWCLKGPRWDVGQRIPVGHWGQHPERADKTAQYVEGRRQLRLAKNSSWRFMRWTFFTVTGKSNVSEVLPTGQLSNIPWRRAGVKYTNNEAYFDVIEEVGSHSSGEQSSWSHQRWTPSSTRRAEQYRQKSMVISTVQWSSLGCPTSLWALSIPDSSTMSPFTPVSGGWLSSLRIIA